MVFYLFIMNDNVNHDPDSIEIITFVHNLHDWEQVKLGVIILQIKDEMCVNLAQNGQVLGLQNYISFVCWTFSSIIFCSSPPQYLTREHVEGIANIPPPPEAQEQVEGVAPIYGRSGFENRLHSAHIWGLRP